MAMTVPMSSGQRAELIAKSSEVFSPAAPINRKDLFAGRIQQLQRVFDAVNTRGQHAIIFGERGVGKTSLANIVQEIATNPNNRARTHVTKVNCGQIDDFGSVWRKTLSQMRVIVDHDGASMAFRATPESTIVTADQLVSDNPSPHEIQIAATAVGKSVIIFDEFDRLSSGQALFADTIKTLSDASVEATIVIVGVAHDIDDLLKEHASVDRALIQILMPRMATHELHEILNKAMDSLGMTMDADARNLIVLLSQGLPHYTHVLGKASTMQSLTFNRWNISLNDVHEGISNAVANTQQSIRSSYQTATASPRKDTLFKQVLLACALSDVDAMGYFASADVRDPLSAIMGKPYDIPNFSQHLDKFCSDERGKVLERAGTQRRFRFRFSNPLLQPFVIMRGLSDGIIKGEIMNLLERRFAEN